MKRLQLAHKYCISVLFTVFVFLNPVWLKAGTPVIDVHVDPRMELLYIVWSMTDWPKYFGAYSETSPYAKDVATTFHPHVNHPAVRIFTEMAQNGSNWAFDAPPNWILCYGPPPKLEPIAPIPEGIVKRAGGTEKVAKLAESFRAFAKDTNFEAFFNAHRPLYDKLETEYRYVGKVDTRWKTLVNFFGTSPTHATVILTPLCYLGNYGPHVQMVDGSVHFFQIDSPTNYSKGAFTFDQDRIGGLIFHEFGHSFANEAVLAYSERNKHSDWLPMIIDSMHKQGYGDWNTVLCESVVRAGEICLAEFGGETDLGKKRRKELLERGWYWVPAMSERMNEFPSHREQYPTFASFMPRLFQVLDELEPITENTPGEFHGTRSRTH